MPGSGFAQCPSGVRPSEWTRVGRGMEVGEARRLIRLWKRHPVALQYGNVGFREGVLGLGQGFAIFPGSPEDRASREW